MPNGKNIANREVCNAIFRDFQTKKPILYVDYANTTTTEMTGESVFAYGGWGHPKRITFNGEKGGTIAFEFQVQPFQLYAIMSGADVENTATYCKREVVKLTDNKLILSETPAGGTDAINIFLATDDCGTKVTGTLSGKELTITGGTPGTEYVVYYDTTVNSGVEKIAIKGTTFPKAFIIDADTIYKNENDETIPMRMKVYKCQPQSQFTLTHSNSGDPGTLTLTCDIMEDPDGNMLDMIAITGDE